MQAELHYKQPFSLVIYSCISAFCPFQLCKMSPPQLKCLNYHHPDNYFHALTWVYLRKLLPAKFLKANEISHRAGRGDTCFPYNVSETVTVQIRGHDLATVAAHCLWQHCCSSVLMAERGAVCGVAFIWAGVLTVKSFCSHVEGFITVAVGCKVEGGGACCVCVCTARCTPSVHVDQWLNYQGCPG